MTLVPLSVWHDVRSLYSAPPKKHVLTGLVQPQPPQKTLVTIPRCRSTAGPKPAGHGNALGTTTPIAPLSSGAGTQRAEESHPASTDAGSTAASGTCASDLEESPLSL